MAEENFYSQGTVNERFKKRVPSRTLLNWAQAGLVEVAKVEVDGRGAHRLYTEDGLVQFGVVEILSDLGVPVERIKKWGYALDSSDPNM
jgi:DNA-binding transcriptional MerR regulator